MHLQKILGFCFVFLLVGCSDPTEGLDSFTTYSLEDVPELQLNRDEDFFAEREVRVSSIDDLEVDSSGTVYIADAYRRRLEVFDADGSHKGTMGKAGSDPGEFQKLGKLDLIGNYLYAHDEYLNRVYAYNLNRTEFGSFTELDVAIKLSAESLKNTQPFKFHVLHDGSYIVGFRKVDAPDKQTVHYYKVNTASQIISDELISYPAKSLYVDSTMTTQVIMMLPYERETLMDIDSEDNFLTLYTEDLVIKKWNSEGEYIEAFYYPFEKRSLSESELVDSYTSVHRRRAIRGASLPNTWPAAEKFMIDDEDRMWVATIVDDFEQNRWYVMDKDGQPLASFVLPKKDKLLTIRDGAFYVKTFNRRTYSIEVLRYQFSI